ncbi:MAG: bifunctional (p)ppGpp synthetase/guanosine-3',5'-bis(diphosphate) 3'-pyrophosphohydrolase [Saprospiraceae bacterium]|nr:bifunctional (p)ppGpp synthetase/guanosine-3',5'-bis(diphosphate) 3'-pyrophosphohydrolase [Candidatus Vicinibacter affinis]MBK6823735.1 bifunctional (p)ppGpp synthetase/guanosine-3',5'-bis(diphosphate) 3'-pyrophosphohydrolase [Candidatus Vicinibacter affinis]MBK8403351.1 bifunctional (p)ppGpp synthetase/guanosine-3',5'-bis(diphosphate) 3'-pyrophosphohydrolase [Candidatus Vicinibacter affinis]
MLSTDSTSIAPYAWPEEDQLLIKAAYRRLLRAIRSANITIEEKQEIRRAFELAFAAHGDQRRKSGEPYINHPLEVARICFEELGLGYKSIIAALLHDVVEDTPVTLHQVNELFGPKISRIVDGLTKLDGLYNVESPQAENFKKVLSTLVDDVRVILIKMADRLHNLRTIDGMPKHKQLKIAAETSYIYAPLAHRLGLYNVKSEFQDICVKITEPDLYRDITSKLKDTHKERNKFINEFIKPLKMKLDQLEMPYKIYGRPKSISSIANKIKTKKVNFEEIFDLFAVRIVVDCPKEKEKSVCWQIYSIVTDVHKPIPERLRDWITTPKSNGYESLHTTVIGPGGKYVEIQIRSARMDDIAEKGYASHWKYKGVADIHGIYDHWFNTIKDMLETPHNDAMEFLHDFKANLYGEEVYIYTPNGDMKVLPKGATALDFAFSIHSDLGVKASACKINNKLVPLGYVLTSGDQVTVITNSKQKPTEDWLKMVTTGKAKSRIRSALKEEQKILGEYGKEILDRKFKNLKISLEENTDILLKTFGFKNKLDLFAAVATQQLEWSSMIKNFNIEGAKLTLIKPVDKDAVREEKEETIEKHHHEPGRLLINNEPADHYQYTLANCCNPVQGDDIFAYVTANSGMKIHRINCPNAENLMVNYGYRILKAEWTSVSGSRYTVDLNITGIDDGPGVIERLTHNISSILGVNIKSFSIAGHEGTFEGKVGLIVSNKDQINQIIQSLSQLPGISNVSRVIH